MWYEGIFGEFSWSAKVFDEPSIFGINKGRISKLSIKYRGVLVYIYDRGLDIDILKQELLDAILEDIIDHANNNRKEWRK